MKKGNASVILNEVSCKNADIVAIGSSPRVNAHHVNTGDISVTAISSNASVDVIYDTEELLRNMNSQSLGSNFPYVVVNAVNSHVLIKDLSIQNTQPDIIQLEEKSEEQKKTPKKIYYNYCSGNFLPQNLKSQKAIQGLCESSVSLWNLDFKNRFSMNSFIGRAQEFHQFAGEFETAKSGLKAQVITGLSGMGKTRLAEHYAHIYREYYDLVWWIDGGDNLDKDFRDLAFALQSLGYGIDLSIEELSLDKLLEHIKKFLRTQPVKWLLIFDDVENNSNFRRYLPEHQDKNSYGHIVTTSCNSNWPLSFKKTQLNKLVENDAIALLAYSMRKEFDDTDKIHASKLAYQLDYLPLVLIQAGTFLSSSMMSIKEYTQEYETVLNDLLENEPLPADYEYDDERWRTSEYADSRRLSATWQFWLNRLKKTDLTALTLINYCSYLDPTEIPWDVVEDLLGGVNKIQKQRSFQHLNQNYLISSSLPHQSSQEKLPNYTFTVHKLVQYVVRETHSSSEKASYILKCIELFNQRLKDDDYNLLTLVSNKALLTHGESILNHAHITVENDYLPTMIELCRKIAMNYLHLRNNDSAIRMFQKLVEWHGFQELKEKLDTLVSDTAVIKKHVIRKAQRYIHIVKNWTSILIGDVSPSLLKELGFILENWGMAYFYRYQDRELSSSSNIDFGHAQDIEKAIILSSIALEINESFSEFASTRVVISLCQIALIAEVGNREGPGGIIRHSWLKWLIKKYKLGEEEISWDELSDNHLNFSDDLWAYLLQHAFHTKFKAFKLHNVSFSPGSFSQFKSQITEMLERAPKMKNPYLVTMIKTLSYFMENRPGGRFLGGQLLEIILQPAISLYGEHSITVAEIEFELAKIGKTKEQSLEKTINIFSEAYGVFHIKVYQVMRLWGFMQLERTFNIETMAAMTCLRRAIEAPISSVRCLAAALLMAQKLELAESISLSNILVKELFFLQDPLIILLGTSQLVKLNRVDNRASILIGYLSSDDSRIRDQAEVLLRLEEVQKVIDIQEVSSHYLESTEPLLCLVGIHYQYRLRSFVKLGEIFNESPKKFEHILNTLMIYLADFDSWSIRVQWSAEFAMGILSELEKEDNILFKLLKSYLFCFHVHKKEKIKSFVLGRINHLLIDALDKSTNLMAETEFLEEIEMLIAILSNKEESIHQRLAVSKVLCKFKVLFEVTGIFSQITTFDTQKIKIFLWQELKESSEKNMYNINIICQCLKELGELHSIEVTTLIVAILSGATLSSLDGRQRMIEVLIEQNYVDKSVLCMGLLKNLQEISREWRGGKNWIVAWKLLEKIGETNSVEAQKILMESTVNPSNSYIRKAAIDVLVQQESMEQQKIRGRLSCVSEEELLRCAAGAGALEVVQNCCEVKKVDMNAQDPYSDRTALHWASCNKEGRVIRYLLCQRVQLNIMDGQGKFAWEYVLDTPLIELYCQSREILLSKYSLSSITTSSLNLGRLLRKAVRNGCLGDVRYCCEVLKIDINVQNDESLSQKTPLHCAVIKGNVDIVRYLVARGANVELKDGQNKTALTYAQKHGSKKEELEAALIGSAIPNVMSDASTFGYKN